MTREEAIEFIAQSVKSDVDMAKVADAIKALEQEQKWIPVSEKLPKDGKWALFTDGSNISVERYKKDAIDHFFPQERWFSFDKAIAWMPLPEPYKAESASEKEKLKAEVNGYFYGLNAAGKIDWQTYNTLYNVCMSILGKYYDRMEKERRAESEEETNRLQVGDKIEVQFGKETHFATAIQQRDDVMLFLTDDYLDDAMPINPTDTTERGWEGSELRKRLQDIAKNTDIKDYLTPFENGDLLTLLSTQEMFGLDENYKKCDGQIEWLKDRWHRIAGRKADAYERGWLRPVITGPCSAFVDDSGSLAGYTRASNALGVRPAFAIRIRDQGMTFLPFADIWRPQNRK